MGPYPVSKDIINKENLKPSLNCETQAYSNLKSETKAALLITDADGLNQQKCVLKPSNMEIDFEKSQ